MITKKMVSSVKSTNVGGNVSNNDHQSSCTPRYLKIIFCGHSEERSLKYMSTTNYGSHCGRKFTDLECYTEDLDKRRNDFALIVVGTSVNYQKFNIFG